MDGGADSLCDVEAKSTVQYCTPCLESESCVPQESVNILSVFFLKTDHHRNEAMLPQSLRSQSLSFWRIRIDRRRNNRSHLFFFSLRILVVSVITLL